MSLSKESNSKVAPETIMATELEVEAQMALIQENPARLSEVEDVSELLEKLTDANAAAEGMESKLDSILENLDNLLSALDSSEHLPDDIKAPDDDIRPSEAEKSSSS